MVLWVRVICLPRCSKLQPAAPCCLPIRRDGGLHLRPSPQHEVWRPLGTVLAGQRYIGGPGGGDPSVLDANYPPNCWPEAPWGGGLEGGGSGRGKWGGGSRRGLGGGGRSGRVGCRGGGGGGPGGAIWGVGGVWFGLGQGLCRTPRPTVSTRLCADTTGQGESRLSSPKACRTVDRPRTRGGTHGREMPPCLCVWRARGVHAGGACGALRGVGGGGVVGVLGPAGSPPPPPGLGEVEGCSGPPPRVSGWESAAKRLETPGACLSPLAPTSTTAAPWGIGEDLEPQALAGHGQPRSLRWSTLSMERVGVGSRSDRQRDSGGGGGGVGYKASVSICVPLAAPIGLSPLLILTLCGPERVLVVSTEPPDDWSCLTTPGVGRPGDGLLPVPLTRCIPMHTLSPCGGLPTPALTCARWGVHLQDNFPDRGFLQPQWFFFLSGGGEGSERPRTAQPQFARANAHAKRMVARSRFRRPRRVRSRKNTGAPRADASAGRTLPGRNRAWCSSSGTKRSSLLPCRTCSSLPTIHNFLGPTLRTLPLATHLRAEWDERRTLMVRTGKANCYQQTPNSHRLTRCLLRDCSRITASLPAVSPPPPATHIMTRWFRYRSIPSKTQKPLSNHRRRPRLRVRGWFQRVDPPQTPAFPLLAQASRANARVFSGSGGSPDAFWLLASM